MIKSEEAFSLFERRTEETKLLCATVLFGWGVLLEGRVSRLSQDEVSLLSIDGRSAIAIRLNGPDLFFEYSEPKDVPEMRNRVPEEVRHAFWLTVALPLPVPVHFPKGPLRAPKREKLFFVELPESGVDIKGTPPL